MEGECRELVRSSALIGMATRVAQLSASRKSFKRPGGALCAEKGVVILKVCSVLAGTAALSIVSRTEQMDDQVVAGSRWSAM